MRKLDICMLVFNIPSIINGSASRKKQEIALHDYFISKYTQEMLKWSLLFFISIVYYAFFSISKIEFEMIPLLFAYRFTLVNILVAAKLSAILYKNQKLSERDNTEKSNSWMAECERKRDRKKNTCKQKHLMEQNMKTLENLYCSVRFRLLRFGCSVSDCFAPVHGTIYM